MKTCEWCNDVDSSNPYPDTDHLCLSHMAEYLGMTESTLERELDLGQSDDNSVWS